MSVVDPCGLIYAEVMEGGKPKLNGLMDPRQGTIDRYSRWVFKIYLIHFGMFFLVLSISFFIS